MTQHSIPPTEPPAPGGEVEPFWAKEVFIDTAWVRGTETPESIAERLDHLTRALQQTPGITPWKEPDLYGTEWPTDPAGQHEAIRGNVMTYDDDKPAPEDGYSILLASTPTRGPARGLELSLHINAGVRFPGAPHTNEGTRIRIAPDLFQPPPPGAHITLPLAENVLHSSIIAWDATYARLSSEWQPPHPPYTTPNPFFRPSHQRWQIPTGYRVWLHDTIGPVTHLAPGITATRFHTGTMLAAPDHWTPQQVGEAMFTTLDLNNINELPR